MIDPGDMDYTDDASFAEDDAYDIYLIHMIRLEDLLDDGSQSDDP